MFFKLFLVVVLLLVLSYYPSFAKNIGLLNRFEITGQDTTINDLSFDFNEKNEADNLLPERMSFMERFLWSKNGFLRKTGIVGELTLENRSKEISLRRTMLTIHQTSGLLTWGLMTASVITGQLWLDGKISSPDLHRTLVRFTIGGYLLTGLVSVVIPPPIIRRDEFSTVTVHKTLAWLHFAGMVATPILGRIVRQSNDYYKAARVHQISAYVTTAIYTSAMLVILLFE